MEPDLHRALKLIWPNGSPSICTDRNFTKTRYLYCIRQISCLNTLILEIRYNGEHPTRIFEEKLKTYICVIN